VSDRVNTLLPKGEGPVSGEVADAARPDRVLESPASPLSWHVLFEALPDGSALLDPHGVMYYVSQTLLEMSGYTTDELVGQDIQILVPPRLRDLEVATREGRRHHPNERIIWSDGDISMLRKDGGETTVDFALAPLRIEGRPWMIAMVRDNTARRAAEAARADVELRFRVAFENNMAPMSFTGVDDRLIAVNDAFCEMVGFSREELLGQDSTLFTYPEDVGITESTRHRAIIGETEQERYVKRYLRKDGRVIDVEVSRSPARDAAGEIKYFVFSERDITEERALNEQLSHRALHDPLTGLANRTLFEDRVEHAHARISRQGGFGAVLLIDLDDFKGVNDTLGHIAGDQLLTTLARRLEIATRASDTLCRFGGDEFLYLAESLESAEEAEGLAERLRKVIAEPIALGETLIEQHASVGVVIFDRTTEDATEILRNVDAALYEAKSLGRGNHVVFTPSMHERAKSRFALIQELRHALTAGEIAMHYQPITDLATTGVVGFEALMRWHNPLRGWIPPNAFLPLAEQSDLGNELGRFALESAIAEAARWQAGSPGDAPYVTVNLSERHFRSVGLLPMVRDLLARHGLDPSLLVLEITEGVALSDMPGTMSILEALRELGVGIALDDFGIGFAQLVHLVELNPRMIKIDQSFVRPPSDNERHDLVLEMIVNLGRRLHMTVLAEGIETPGQYHRVRQLGCELGQGFLFSAAVPAAEAANQVGRVLGA
jgi:diguanylate cyclase (GGDEF)-like protein/PAS domain S-box-containing protein